MNLKIYLFIPLVIIFGTVHSKTRPKTPDEICALPLKKGYCLQNIPRFYYNSLENKCLPFTYKGCGGNENRFKTKEACESMCMKKTTMKSINNQSRTTSSWQKVNETTTRIINLTKSTLQKK
ncbi:unnamed protein product [Schistosoma bovis]|uniref:BPTI/Kunitz inhibitor domain-containing protein n=1 Tax=Schistosoma bovis TaxID=6184 RepID=A0A430PYD7_SCHBO|nr:uncharacterized protein DC041_0010446 [Schistosoma bovis]CAH8514259.1 unnamed protein product [Schistosoma bovis]